MTPEQQRIAIAQSLGFKREVGCTGIVRWRKGDELFDKLPDYLNDLHAMHEAEGTLTDNQQTEYWNALWNLAGSEFRLLHATASQRAEAFLRTLGKWVD